jgi:hypothetical protein
MSFFPALHYLIGLVQKMKRSLKVGIPLKSLRLDMSELAVPKMNQFEEREQPTFVDFQANPNLLKEI